MLAVPALSRFVKLDERKAHASAIMLTLPMTVFSAIYYVMNSELNLKIAFEASIAGIAGSLIGAKLLCRLSTPVIRLIFGIVMAVAGIFMVLK
jgi:uncharacterized membrane protein YfcA